jgi:hypothetical protein
MLFQTLGFIIALCLVADLTFSFVCVSAIELNFTNDFTNDFTKNLQSKINGLVSNALNETDSILNSSFINGSNLTSSNIVVSNSNVASIVTNNGSEGSNTSIIKDQVKTINGVCNSIKVGGKGNDTLFSSGNCNDILTGGPGADKFTCGEGNDTIKDYKPKEGDVILDKHKCEKVL